MNESFIFKQIQRSNRNLKILCTLLLLATLITLGMFRNYYYNFFLGPFPLTPAELESADSGKDFKKVFVKLDSSSIINLGYKEFEETSKNGVVISKKDTAYYFATKLPFLLPARTSSSTSSEPTSADIQFIIVKLGINDRRIKGHLEDPSGTISLSEKDKMISGELVPIPSDVKSYVSTDLASAYGHFRAKRMLDATGYRTDGYIGLSVGAVLVGLSIFGLYNAGKRKDPIQHPIGRYLNQIGNLDQLTGSIEAELQKAHELGHKFGSITITKSWLFQPSLWGLKIVYLPEVLWVYQRIVQHRHNGIPAGKTFSILLWDRKGTKFEIGCKKKRVALVLETIMKQIPWVILGYDKKLESHYQTDRPALIALVDERRKGPSMTTETAP